jgi:hypothetical protein
MVSTPKFILILIFASLLSVGLALPEASIEPDGLKELDRPKLEREEDLSEALANDLLELSIAVRDKNLPRISTFFSDTIRVAKFPAQPDELIHEVKSIYRHGWKSESDAPFTRSNEGFLKDWELFLSHFSEIEDVRFKVKASRFDSDGQAQARIFFYLVGRDPGHQREWGRGYANIAAHGSTAEGSWRIDEYLVESVESMGSASDLFSEVSQPAGVAAFRPAYGFLGDTGFIWPGAAAGDIDLDGDVDLFVTAEGQNYLYLNSGDGRFQNISRDAMTDFTPGATAPLLLDYDNDGDLDIFVASVGEQFMLQNRLKPDGAPDSSALRSLTFWDVSHESGVDIPAIGFSAVAGDVNNDGWPDIYVACYNRFGVVMPNSWHRATNGTPNLLFVNQKNGRFVEAAKEWGVDDGRWSYAAQFADLDGDGDQDLYVANDFGENALYLSDGSRFVDAAAERGVLDPGNGMGVSLSDYDNDGDLDLHVTNMSSTAGNRILGRLFPKAKPEENVLKKLASGNSLYENRGDGFFKNVTEQAGGFSAGWAWGGGFIDFDNDGREDIYTAAGFISGKSMKDT